MFAYVREPIGPAVFASEHVMNANKIGRNDPCHCGSGLKYKKCHAAQDEAARSAELTAQAAARAEEAAAKAAEAAESDEEQPVSAKAGKSSGQYESGAAKQPRPKLPSPHNMGLPRRGAI